MPKKATAPPFLFSTAASPMVGTAPSKGMMSHEAVIQRGRLVLEKALKSLRRNTDSCEIWSVRPCPT